MVKEFNVGDKVKISNRADIGFIGVYEYVLGTIDSINKFDGITYVSVSFDDNNILFDRNGLVFKDTELDYIEKI